MRIPGLSSKKSVILISGTLVIMASIALWAIWPLDEELPFIPMPEATYLPIEGPPRLSDKGAQALLNGNIQAAEKALTAENTPYANLLLGLLYDALNDSKAISFLIKAQAYPEARFLLAMWTIYELEDYPKALAWAASIQGEEYANLQLFAQIEASIMSLSQGVNMLSRLKDLTSNSDFEKAIGAEFPYTKLAQGLSRIAPNIKKGLTYKGSGQKSIRESLRHGDAMSFLFNGIFMLYHHKCSYYSLTHEEKKEVGAFLLFYETHGEDLFEKYVSLINRCLRRYSIDQISDLRYLGGKFLREIQSENPLKTAVQWCLSSDQLVYSDEDLLKCSATAYYDDFNCTLIYQQMWPDRDIRKLGLYKVCRTTMLENQYDDQTNF